MNYSQYGYKLTKFYEGLRLVPYQDQRGLYTIGYGHRITSATRPASITEQQANTLLQQDIQIAVTAVNEAVRVKLTQNQFDAIVDLCFNIGETAFKDSTLVRLLNAGDYIEAGKQILVWDHANGTIDPGLLRRREAEYSLWNTAA